MKKKTDKVKILSHTEISEVLKQQQETVSIVDKYIQHISLPMRKPLNLNSMPILSCNIFL